MTQRYAAMLILLLTSPLFAQENTATRRLAEQSKQFEEQIIKVVDNVYVAVGYSVSNVSMIIGDDGVVIVDTGMMGEAAKKIEQQFRKITDDGLTTSELEHFTHPSFNVLGRVFEHSVEPLAISIDDVDVVLLVSPIHSDEQARLCGLLVHGSTPSFNGE